MDLMEKGKLRMISELKLAIISIKRAGITGLGGIISSLNDF
jgi:hypothetical protein